MNARLICVLTVVNRVLMECVVYLNPARH
jgi:hypothetical protein